MNHVKITCSKLKMFRNSPLTHPSDSLYFIFSNTDIILQTKCVKKTGGTKVFVVPPELIHIQTFFPI